MNIIEKKQSELKEIEKKINALKIDNSIYETMALLNKRISLGKDLDSLRWKNKSPKEKNCYRIDDLELTKKYYEKYGEEVKNKLVYKEKYIALLNIVDQLINNLKNDQVIIFRIIKEILDSSDYIDTANNECLNLIISEFKGKFLLIKEFESFFHLYDELKNMPFEIK